MRILIIRLGAIGDVIHTLPALAAIKSEIRDSSVTWVVERGPAHTLLTGNPCIDDLLVVDLRRFRRAGFDTTIAGTGEALKGLRRAKFDLSIDFQGLLKSAAIPWLARVPRRIGFAFGALREPASGLLLSERVPVDDAGHIIEKNLSLARYVGCNQTREYRFPLAVAEADRSFAENVISRVNAGFAIINPGCGWETKLWEPGRFATIADRLWREMGIKSLITFGPGEDRLAHAVVACATEGSALPVESTLKQFFAIARRATLFLGGDTGPMHLAAAAGTPIVALFGPSSSRRNGPFDSQDLVVERTDLECRVGCYRRRCSHISCMDIPTEVVWETVVRRLQGVEARVMSTSIRGGRDQTD